MLHLQITHKDIILFNTLDAPHHLACIHTGWDHIRLLKPQRHVQPIHQRVFMYKLTSLKTGIQERSSCVLRGLNHAPVKHHVHTLKRIFVCKWDSPNIDHAGMFEPDEMK